MSNSLTKSGGTPGTPGTPIDRPIDDATMQRMLSSRTPLTGFLLRRGPSYDDPATAPLQWEHARNMFRLLEAGTVVHVSALLDGDDVLGFGLSTLTPEDTSAELARDPGVAGGRLTFDLATTMSFDGPRDAPLLRATPDA